MARRRPQKPKMPGNRDMALAFQEIRRSSAASPHKNRAKYDRNRDKRSLRREAW